MVYSKQLIIMTVMEIKEIILKNELPSVIC